MPVQSFSTLATHPDPPVDELALALAAEFREIDDAEVRAQLDELGDEVAIERAERHGPTAGVDALREVLGLRHGFCGDRRRYDHPNNSMLDVVLERRRGLPIALSVVYVATARRAGIALEGVGLPGHFVVGDFESGPPLLLDPFDGGALLADRLAARRAAVGRPRDRAADAQQPRRVVSTAGRTSCARSRRRSCGSTCRSTAGTPRRSGSSSARCARA